MFRSLRWRAIFAAVALPALITPASAQPSPRSGADAIGKGSAPLISDVNEPRGPLALRDALALALAQNPELSGYSWDIRSAEARQLQAGLLPNPEFEITSEEFGGQGDRRGYRAAETTIRFSQLIELGAKRSRRVAVAGNERDLAALDYQSKRLDVLARTSRAFVDLLAAQQRLAFAEEVFQLGTRTLDAVLQRITAGRESPVEETKARVALAALRLDVERARRDIDGARKRLAANWSSNAPVFLRAEGRLDETVDIPSLESLRERTTANPDLSRWSTEIQLRESDVALERSKAIPDVTVSAGVRRFEETDDQAFLVGVAIPLPVFNRNQGGRLEAGFKLNRAYGDRRATQVRIDADLAAAHNALLLANDELTALRAEVIPGAERSFEAAQQAYRLGRSGFLDVLDAQRTLLEARSRLIDALAEYQRAVVDIERLTAQPVRPIAPDGK
jgi:cobalt-zinc-cadmium efflux system outer membrane protein